MESDAKWGVEERERDGESLVQLRFLENFPPSPPPSQHFALNEKLVLMLSLREG